MATELTPFIRGKNYFLLLTAFFIVFELYFIGALSGNTSNGFLVCLVKSGIIGLCFYLFYVGIRWSKWLLTIVLVSYSLLLGFAALDEGNYCFIIGCALCLYIDIIVHVNRNIKAFFNERHGSITIVAEGAVPDDVDIDMDMDGDIEFPGLMKRVAAAFIDALVTFSLVGIFVTAASHINDDSVVLKIAAIVLGASYEPVMNAFGRTFGQMFFGIKVVNVNSGGKVNLASAYLRFICKSLLGWLSFIVMFSNAQRRAIHDFIAGTIVVYK